MITMQSLLELQPTIGSPVQLFGDDAFLANNTMLSRRGGARVERASAAGYLYDKEEYLRSLAPATGRSAASKTVLGQTPSTKLIGGVYFRINIPFTGELLSATRNPGEISANAAAQVQKGMRSIRQRLLLSKEKLWSMALAGTTTINSTNFPDGTVEGVSISWGLNTLAEALSWANIAAYIISGDCQTWNAQILDASGHMIGEFIFNETVSSYLLKNTEMHDFTKALDLSERIAKEGAAAFAGLGQVGKWTPYLGAYKPEGGSVTRFVSNNALMALPEGWEQMVCEARYPMDRPGSQFLVATSDPMGMIPDEVYGDDEGIDYYAYQQPDPAAMVLVGQMAVQPIIKLPEAFGYDASVIA